MIINKIWDFIRGKKEEIPNYPREFIIIDFTPVAKQNGIRDEHNKIIIRYYMDSFGKRKSITYKYSDERLDAFMKISQIPILDKTNKKEIMPVFGKMLPSEVSYNR